MEQDKDKIIKALQAVLEDPKLVTLTKEEIAVILCQDVVEPLFKELEDHFARIAYIWGNYDSRSSH